MKLKQRFLHMVVAMILAAAVVAIGSYAEDAAPERVLRETIDILADADFTAANGVVSGAGTKEDPYIISGYAIDVGRTSFGIRIQNTDSWFEIVDCIVRGPGTSGIRFLNVENGTIRSCTVSETEFGIDIDSSRDCSFIENRVQSCGSSIFLYAASFNTFSENAIENGIGGFTLYAGSCNNHFFDNMVDAGSALTINAGCDSNWIYRNDFLRGRASSNGYNRWHSKEDEGNYWANYSGEDEDGDGFGELVYRLLGSSREFDYHPAIVPYHLEDAD